MNALLCAPDMDEDLFAALMEALQLRLRDREAPVRAQAVLCLSKLSPEATLEALEDPSAEVRRAVLLVTDSPETLAARTRDVDITNRRVVCSRMSDCPFSALQEVHTRKSILAACKDREEVVRRAAGKMVSKWMGQDTLETFLGHFDLLNMPDEAQIAVNAAIRTRPDVAANLAFDGTCAATRARAHSQGAAMLTLIRCRRLLGPPDPFSSFLSPRRLSVLCFKSSAARRASPSGDGAGALHQGRLVCAQVSSGRRGSAGRAAVRLGSALAAVQFDRLHRRGRAKSYDGWLHWCVFSPSFLPFTQF